MNSDYEKIIQFATTHFTDVKGVYLFGSQADGSANSKSDYDIALLFKEPKAIDPILLF